MQRRSFRHSFMISARLSLVVVASTMIIFTGGCPLGPVNGTPDDGNPAPDDGSGGRLEPVEVIIDIDGQGSADQEPHGSFVTLTATPDAGWRFDEWSWSGSRGSDQNPVTLSVADGTSVTARFVPIEGGPDRDGDGVGDSTDNCPDTANGSQTDNDHDGLGNACDNCPDADNFEQTDEDEDGRGDACDNCPELENADQADADGDGLGNLCDNCPNVANPRQFDSDNDALGNGCDLCPVDPLNDTDGDGVCAEKDQCPSTPTGTTVDQRGCPVTVAECGNGVIEFGEQCDPPDDITCADDCQLIPGGGPPNDACEDAIQVGDGETSFSSVGAHTDGPDTASCDLLGSDIWYCYQATCDGIVTISLCDSEFDTKMAVYGGCACPTTDPLACDDDGCCAPDGIGCGSLAAINAAQGDSFLIRVGGSSAQQGEGTLLIACGLCEVDADCDDGLFCNGTETCETESGNCISGTEPCATNETCDEVNDTCQTPVTMGGTWQSTQFLAQAELPEQVAPETYHVGQDGVLTAASPIFDVNAVAAAWQGSASVLSNSVPPGVPTTLFRVDDAFLEIGAVGTGRLTIDTFTVASDGLTATWTFDFTYREQLDASVGSFTVDWHYVGQQTGTVSNDVTLITWTDLVGTVGVCTNLLGCSDPTDFAGEWTLGSWTRQ